MFTWRVVAQAQITNRCDVKCYYASHMYITMLVFFSQRKYKLYTEIYDNNSLKLYSKQSD